MWLKGEKRSRRYSGITHENVKLKTAPVGWSVRRTRPAPVGRGEEAVGHFALGLVDSPHLPGKTAHRQLRLLYFKLSFGPSKEHFNISFSR